MKIDEYRIKLEEINRQLRQLNNEKQLIEKEMRRVLQECDNHQWGEIKAHLGGNRLDSSPHINTWSRTCTKCGAKEVTASVAECRETNPATGLQVIQEVPNFDSEELLQRW